MAVTKATLKKELHKLGIKTYKNTKTQASYVKKTDVLKILAAPAPLEWIKENMADHMKTAFEEAARVVVDEAMTQMPDEVVKQTNYKKLMKDIIDQAQTACG